MMEIFWLFTFCLGGLALLVAGGEWLTASSSKLAAGLGVRPIVIGLTVVAFGTSMPEAFVSIFAALQQKSDIAAANVIGSNIFNIAFILGVAAMIRPLKVEAGSIKREVPFLIGAAGLFWLLAYDRIISRTDAMIFLTALVIFLWVCFRSANNADPAEEEAQPKSQLNKVFLAVQIAFSLMLLVIGARLLIYGVTDLARLMGVSDLLIGLTVVAAGTSLPELAASVMASIRSKDDIAVGNVTGSNIFNVLFILGVSALVAPMPISELLFTRDLTVMLVVSLVALPILKSGFVISRAEGLLLVSGYVCYTIYLASYV